VPKELIKKMVKPTAKRETFCHRSALKVSERSACSVIEARADDRPLPFATA
jgi:hypothetical protein